MSNEALTWAFKQDLPMTEKFVLVALADYADDQHSCFPSHATTAQRVGSSRDTVRRAVRRLEDKGFLKTVSRQRDNRSMTSNRYYLAVDNSPVGVGADCTGGRERTGAGGASAPGVGADSTGARCADAPPISLNEPSDESSMHPAPGPFDGPAPVDMWNACHGENDDPWTGQPRLSA